MGIWDAIVIVALLGISAKLVKSLFKTHTKSKTVSKDSLPSFVMQSQPCVLISTKSKLI